MQFDVKPDIIEAGILKTKSINLDVKLNSSFISVDTRIYLNKYILLS